MPVISAQESKIKAGVKVQANQLTTIQLQLASLELLVGGPYGNHPYGHTAIRVTTKNDDKIYDYGRYGLTWGVGNSEGQGVLRIWSSFAAYISGENDLGRKTTAFLYEVGEEQAQKVDTFFESKIKGKKPLSASSKMRSFLIEDYYALGPNCTTISVAAAKVAIHSIDRNWAQHQKGRGLSFMERSVVTARGWPAYIFMPADLQAMLESEAERRPKSVKIHGGRP